MMSESLARELLHYLRSQLPAMLELLQQLVRA